MYCDEVRIESTQPCGIRVNVEVKIAESDRCAGFTQLIVVGTKIKSSCFLTQILPSI